MAVLVDNLSPVSRAFYERTRFKFFLSVIYGAAALTLIGFSSEAGGISYAMTNLAKVSTTTTTVVSNIFFSVFYLPVDLIILSSDSNVVTSNYDRMSGYAFACFSHFVAFILAVAAAFIISPVLSGSPNEKTTLRNPIEIVDIMSTTEVTGNEQTVKDWIEQERMENINNVSRISVLDSKNNTPLKSNEY